MKPIYMLYSSEDEKRALEVIKSLRGIGIEVFDPHNDIAAGDVIRDVLSSKLQESRLVVVLISARFYCMERSVSRIDNMLWEMLPKSKKTFGYITSACLWAPIAGVEIRFGNVVVNESIVRDLVTYLVQ